MAFLAGMMFGVGLAVSQMIDPDKVLGFLDVAGSWDPSLALVMVGALSVSIVAFQVILPKRPKPFFDTTFNLPTRREITPPLLTGSALFGIGWGLTGYCPGPAVASLGFGFTGPIVTVASILAGFLFHRKFIDRS